jgi:hypothetical protein
MITTEQNKTVFTASIGLFFPIFIASNSMLNFLKADIEQDNFSLAKRRLPEVLKFAITVCRDRPILPEPSVKIDEEAYAASVVWSGPTLIA